MPCTANGSEDRETLKELVACLIMMSVVKDAERIGDPAMRRQRRVKGRDEPAQ